MSLLENFSADSTSRLQDTIFDVNCVAHSFILYVYAYKLFFLHVSCKEKKESRCFADVFSADVFARNEL